MSDKRKPRLKKEIYTRVTEDEHRQVKELAKKFGTSVSNLTRTAIRKLLSDN